VIDLDHLFGASTIERAMRGAFEAGVADRCSERWRNELIEMGALIGV
jgi:hypothetical protein